MKCGFVLRTRLIFWWIMATIMPPLVITLAAFLIVAVTCTVIEKVEEDGLKGVAEELWYGEEGNDND